jgi:hypothetical protein
LEAVYAADIGGGAAVGTVEEVFVAEPGRFPSLRERVFSKECAHNLALRWEAPRTLRVSYDMASDVRDDPGLGKPSPFSVFSSAYWVFGHPHGVSVRFARRITPPSNDC